MDNNLVAIKSKNMKNTKEKTSQRPLGMNQDDSDSVIESPRDNG
jgi:hypothetical protein